MRIESPKFNINKSAQDTFNYLSDVKNFEQLMPENISKFEMISDTKFVFALKGMPEIVLEKKEAVPPNKIVLGAGEGKIDFTLTGLITEIEPQKSEIQLLFEGNINPMMAMLIKKPITNFIETLAGNLPKVV